MSFKRYLENGQLTLPIGTVNNNPTNFIPPEGHPIGGPKIVDSSTDMLWKLVDIDGIKYIILNEFALKQKLQDIKLVVKDGLVHYDKVNRIITFTVVDVVGELKIEQLSQVENMMISSYQAIEKVKVEPNGRVTIILYPMVEIGGVPNE